MISLGIYLLPLLVMPVLFVGMMAMLIVLGETRQVPAPVDALAVAVIVAVAVSLFLDTPVIEALPVSVAICVAYPAADNRLARNTRLASVVVSATAIVGIVALFENTTVDVLKITMPALLSMVLVSGYLSRRWNEYGGISS